ncbi:MAG: hypothetical protein GY940_21865 [bacterium]|nr:hypothetical protein [bacterium]
MKYIQNTSDNNYSVKTMNRSNKNFKLNFDKDEGNEVNATKSLEVKNSFIQMNDGQSKIWNMRFAYPTNLSVKYAGKIIIEVI